jgi:hypothetical protein
MTMRLTTNSMQRIAEDLRSADRRAADLDRRGDLADVRRPNAGWAADPRPRIGWPASLRRLTTIGHRA